MSTISRMILIDAVRAYEDFQRTRLSLMNRIRDTIRRVNENIPLSRVEGKKAVRDFGRQYNDQNLTQLLENMEREGRLSHEDWVSINRLLELARESASTETRMKNRILGPLRQEQVWGEYLSHVKGIGEVLAANLVYRFGDCENSPHPSSLWKYCGLHVVNGRAPRRATGERVDWRTDCRTLARKIAESLIKQRSPIFREIYDQTREREEERNMVPKSIPLSQKDDVIGDCVPGDLVGKEPEKRITVTKGVYEKLVKEHGENATVPVFLSKDHIHSRALRKVAKVFLCTFWVASRELAGLPVEDPWIIEHGGHEDQITWRDVLRANQERKVA